MPNFQPGRQLPGLLVFGTILDMGFGTLQHQFAGGDRDMHAVRDFDMTGWTHLCGPVGAPPGYSYPIENRWTVGLAAGWNGGAGPGVCGLAEQSISGQLLTPAAGVRARYRWWTKVSNPARFAVAEEWGRDPAGPLPIALLTPIAVRTAVAIPGVTNPPPPLIPVAIRPVPLVYMPSVIVSALPDRNYHGYFPPAIADAPPRRPPFADPFVRVVSTLDIVDVAPNPWTPEVKTPVNSRAGQAITAAFKLLSLYGTSQAFITALWNSLPSWARTPHARNADKLRDLAANIGELDLGEAFANSLLAGVRTALAGAMYGAATDTLASTFGAAGGFGLYRAWATGEWGYSATPVAWDLQPSFERGERRSTWRNRGIERNIVAARRAVRAARKRQWQNTSRLVRRRILRNRAAWRAARARGRRARLRRVAWLKARGF